MKWIDLYQRLGNQSMKQMRKLEATAIINGNEEPMLLKFRPNGSPYLISKKEYNFNRCTECFNYNISDGEFDFDEAGIHCSDDI